jgi:hypothetical protein
MIKLKIAARVLQWIVYLPASIAADIAAYVVVPIAVAQQRSNRLPRWARWFETEDNDIFGDAGHFERWFPWGGDPAKARGKLYGWAMATAWLLRNRAYYFSSHVIGAQYAVPPHVTVRGDPAVSNRPYVPGWCLRTLDNGYFQLYGIIGWGTNRLVRINIGWKLWGDPLHPNFGQFVFAINPWAKRG